MAVLGTINTCRYLQTMVILSNLELVDACYTCNRKGFEQLQLMYVHIGILMCSGIYRRSQSAYTVHYVYALRVQSKNL